ncbi:hypothetical protein PG996_003048 [Apiospora saccharicola]|uniref:Uncharacterized protein n=1 Tax=Apiospora saccharicola TaxID=335842 RepID=A0ABR1W400_9PEZI
MVPAVQTVGGLNDDEPGGEGRAPDDTTRAGEDEEEERRGWSWRYVANLGQVGEEWLEDVVGLLDWYKSYGEPQEADWSVTAEEVFSAC